SRALVSRARPPLAKSPHCGARLLAPEWAHLPDAAIARATLLPVLDDDADLHQPVVGAPTLGVAGASAGPRRGPDARAGALVDAWRLRLSVGYRYGRALAPA